MRYAITGHTSGLGKALTQYEDIKDNYIGFSRSTGYDISDLNCRKQIIEEANNCQIFINNAYNGFAQTDLLYELFDVWKDRDKFIINISSNTTDGVKLFPHLYSAHKHSLEKAGEQLANSFYPCMVTTLKYGYLGTERILEKNPVPKCIPLNHAVRFIEHAIDLMDDNIRLTTATLIPAQSSFNPEENDR